MKINPYLMFNGDCDAALKFYEQTLGAKIESKVTFAGSPAEKHVPAGWGDKVLHARLMVGDTVVMASDSPPEQYEKPGGFSISISISDKEKGERVFNALAENGATIMPFQQTFWAGGFGMCVDRFGTPWMVNCEQPR